MSVANSGRVESSSSVAAGSSGSGCPVDLVDLFPWRHGLVRFGLPVDPVDLFPRRHGLVRFGLPVDPVDLFPRRHGLVRFGLPRAAPLPGDTSPAPNGLRDSSAISASVAPSPIGALSCPPHGAMRPRPQ